MALLHFDGFDLGILPEYATLGAVSTSSATALGVGQCVTIPAIISGTPYVMRSLPASADLYLGFRYSTPVSHFSPVLSLYGDGGVTEHLRLTWTSPTVLTLGRGATAIATAAVNEPVSAWSYIEVRATIADAGGRCVVRIDGSTVIDFTGDTKNAGTAATLDALKFWGAAAGTAFVRSFDDLYVNDATGAAPNNTFLGPCRVYTLSPTGPGTDTAFTASSGANWTCVDEQPYSASDFVSATTVGARDTYATADLPASVATVFGVRPTAIAKSSDASAVNLKTSLRSAGTVYSGTATALGVSDSTVSTIRATDPATSAAWTVAAVNAAEAGFEVA